MLFRSAENVSAKISPVLMKPFDRTKVSQRWVKIGFGPTLTLWKCLGRPLKRYLGRLCVLLLRNGSEVLSGSESLIFLPWSVKFIQKLIGSSMAADDWSRSLAVNSDWQCRQTILKPSVSTSIESIF